MKKLKNKIFWTILIILSLFLITLLIIYNYQNYNLAKEDVKRSLYKTNDFKLFKENESKEFMDITMYTIVLNKNNKVIDIINPRDDYNDNILNIVNDIIENNSVSTIYIGNLYFNRYSYNYNINNYIIILDNLEINNNLLIIIKTTIALFIICEVIIIIISYLLSSWLIKPVEESFNKQKQFIADASHELKTPIAVIMVSADCLEEEYEKKYIDNIKQESDNMNRLVTSLLDLTKVENSNKVHEKVNLSKLVEKSILPLESLTYEKHITLKYNIESNIYYSCNKDEIVQLINILLDNAIKHTFKNGDIIVELKYNKGNVLLEVINKGVAIAKGEEEKIFARFYRSDKSRNRSNGNYGIGLAIAKRITQNHHGSIKARSKDGYTTFSVILK